MVFLLTLVFIASLFGGIALSVAVFGTGGKRAKVFQDIYMSVEQVEDAAVIYTKNGEYSAVLRMENPVLKYSSDTDLYYGFTALMSNILGTLGEGYALHKQDVFVRRPFHAQRDGDASGRFLSDSYLNFFEGRPYIDGLTYLVITQENKKSNLLSYDAGKWKDFLVKIHKVRDQLVDGGVRCRFLGNDELRLYVDRFFAVNFKDDVFSMSNFKVTADGIELGDRQVKTYSLLDVDNVGLPGLLRPYFKMTVNNADLSVDLLGDLDSIPDVDTVVYNQVIFIPNQKRELALLEKKRNRHSSIPNPGNLIAANDIRNVLDLVAREGNLLVYAHYNLVVSAGIDKDMQKITNHIENIFTRKSIHVSRQSYNQLELFVASFPGNCYRLSPDYDRFLTMSEPALCLMYKEHQAKSDTGNFPKCRYTDRQGVPLTLDITGKEGSVKYTDNSNFFVLGPSGSGKSFFMNTVVRQYYEQNTDVVIVDTGDSYEGLCSYFEGTYISYSKESPISMNPFNVTRKEYSLNFVEKKNFLKSLIFLIFKGAVAPTKIEDFIINQTIVEYYAEFFHPFDGYSDKERKELHERLLLASKKNGEFDQFEDELMRRNDSDLYHVSDEDRQKYERNSRVAEKLKAVIEDSATTDGEKENASRQLQRLTPEVVEGKFLEKIHRDIERIEQQRLSLKVKELSFNSYYEYAVQRIPQIMRQEKIDFAIDDFAAILKPFYRGGELEYTLNNDMDSSLFDERFIVFEIDKVKDDPVLFPIIVLIIMDVFTQKMRIKSDCRKCLVIEEAWKAIATPTMAEYIKYLYKTARKHWAMVGVVTQEIQDITSSEVVKDAIINNSGVFMLLDQSKFKDKFGSIRETLALTDNDCKKIFTINRLDNKEGRSPFKEVFIKRGTEGDVYGVEEPRECYMSYTTEKVEKEALKLYKRELKCNHQQAIEAFVDDWQRSGIGKSLEFAQKVMSVGHVLRPHAVVSDTHKT